MTDYVPPDPSVAEYVHDKNEEMLSYRRRLEPLSDEELKLRLSATKGALPSSRLVSKDRLVLDMVVFAGRV